MRTIGIGALMDKNLILLNSLRLLVKFEIAIFCRKKKRERERERNWSFNRKNGRMKNTKLEDLGKGDWITIERKRYLIVTGRLRTVPEVGPFTRIRIPGMIARDKDVVTLTTVTPRGAKRSSTVLLARIYRCTERKRTFLLVYRDSFTKFYTRIDHVFKF